MTVSDAVREALRQEGPWTTAYVDGPSGEPEGAAESRSRSLRERLRAAGAPDQDAEAIDRALAPGSGPPAPSSRWILVRGGSLVADEAFHGPRKGPEVIAHGAVPQLLPLLRHHQDDARILVVETERSGARIRQEHVGRGVGDVREVEGETEGMTKVGAGRLSQPRLHRHAEEVWKHNQAEVAGVVDDLVRTFDPVHVFVTGDVRARGLLLDKLGGAAAARVVVVDADTRADGADDTALDASIAAALDARRRARLDDATGAAAQNGAEGMGPVVEALQRARAGTLVLDVRIGDLDARLAALRDEPWVARTEQDAYDVPVLDDVPAGEALARAAVLSGAEVLLDDRDEPAEDEARRDRAVREPVAALR
ncbi:hypothetical protein K8F61_13950 [Microbacterium resistens]|uniref:Peptide chain release factor 1 n=1 Tax=Microbacterium resistens TaxID=156977 RepID=A0ABY3RS80_9MICO|nr:hypothetical protein [Microbacterium resistens]UGS25756.1 hypothetical protein K8F61_13950 [Microbacterium resistens]